MITQIITDIILGTFKQIIMEQTKFITKEEALKDSNSNINQDIKRKFVDREVMACVTSLVEYVLSKSQEGDRDAPFSIDDVENYYTYPEYHGDYTDFDGGTEEERDAEIERLKELSEKEKLDEFGARVDLIENDIAELEALDNEPQEVFEWWLVTDRFYEKLKAQGEVVIDDGWLHYYGRCCSGQAILLDHNISVIAADMGILDGQEHSWADRK